MNVVLTDLALIKQRTLTAIVRDEQLGEAAAQKENNRRQRSRLHSYIYDNLIPDPPIVSQVSARKQSNLSLLPPVVAGIADPCSGRGPLISAPDLWS